MAYRRFVNGEILSASQLNTYLLDQVISTYADATARNTAIGANAQYGQVTYLSTPGTFEIYDGVALAWIPLLTQRAWTSYTPTTTNITIGNGTWSSSYAMVGKTVHLKVRFTLGSTSAITGAATFSLPVTATGFGYGTANLNTGSNYLGVAAISGTTNVVTNVVNAAGTYAVQASTSATVPATWATGHVISLSITYEAA